MGPSDAAALRTRLTRLALLSIGAAVVTIGLKTAAWQVTGSIGFLSDAAESLINLVAALMALVTIRFATRPPDEDHMYGHEKAEFLAAGAEGALVLLASVSIAWLAVARLVDPVALEDVGVGIAVSAAASVVNVAVASLLIREGRRLRSITLEADGRHLMTDVWTSVGVIAGVAAVGITGWERLDPLIALAVAVNIFVVGVRLVHRSGGGLLDRALPDDDQRAIDDVLERARSQGIVFHGVRSRQAGRRAFVSLHVLVPGDWTVKQGHDLVEQLDGEIRNAVPGANVLSHLEPVDDPASFADEQLDRGQQAGSPG
jgi:cation diffusion facilitator family transporter